MLRNILIADGNEINRQMLRKILDGEYQIIEVSNGEEALKILHKAHENISAVLLDIVMPVMDGYKVLEKMRAIEELANIPVIVVSGNTENGAEVKALALGANDFVAKPYNPAVIKHRIRNTIKLRETAAVVNAAKWDKLTGLYNREAFFERAAEMISAREPGYYILACFDIDSFKVINDQYGTQKGDEVLRYIASIFRSGFGAVGGICCRVTADNFAVLYPRSFAESEEISKLRQQAAALDGSIRPITFSIGRYVIDDLSLSVSAMYDRAALAETSVKGRYDIRIAQYDESMRDRLLREQKIVTEMNKALEDQQFEVWFQPQYNHTSGALIGAEALVRWRHPENGLLIPPGEFIPVFERNGFIYEMDKYVWRETCRLLRKWLDTGRSPLPVSVNVSRYDVFRSDFFETLTGYIEEYQVPIDLLRLEITESAFAQSAAQIISVVKKLIDYGFTVEIDDFGSGYSSLNTLKDVPATILKLDMRFLEDSEDSQRGGNILESVVRMAKWLGMSVIAEGVETRAQADYLKSIGCYLIQGYLYAKPMMVEEYEQLASKSVKTSKLMALETVDMLDNNTFWNPHSMETLIFNSYVGGACIFELRGDQTELLRANDKYAQELGGIQMSAQEALTLNLSKHMDEHNYKLMHENIEKAISSNTESTCELCLTGLSGTNGKSYIRTTVRMIATASDRRLFYCSIINMTAQRKAEQQEHALAEQMQAIMNNINGGVSAVTVDKAGKVHFAFANAQYYSILGYTKEQFQMEVADAFEIVHPDDREKIRAIISHVIETRGSDVYQYRCIKRDGSLMHMRCSASVTSIPSVGENVLLSVTNDITEMRLAEEQIIQSSEQLQFLNETAHDLLTQTNTDKGIEEVLQRILDYFDGDRAYVIELDFLHGVSNNTYEVCGDGISGQKEFLKDLPLDTSPFWFRAFDQEGFVSITDVAAMDESRAQERFILQQQGIHSLIAVPLRRDGLLVGFLGVDGPHKQQSHVDHLKAIGDYVAAMLYRRDLTAKIENDNRTLTDLMNDTPGGFVRMRVLPDNRIIPLYFNDGFCNMVGMSRDELMENYKDSTMWGIHPDDLEIVQTTVDEMLTTGEARSAKYRLRHVNGGYVWVIIFGRMTRDASGEPFFNVYYTEPTDQEKKELSFRDMLPAALAAMMESAAELSFVKDKNFNYMCCSRAFAKMVGLQSEKEILGKTDYDLFDAALAAKYREDDRRLLETGEPLIDYEEQLPSDDSSARYSSTSKYLLYDSCGNIIGLYGTGWDITKARKATEELARERSYQEALDTSLPVCTIMFSLKDGRLLHVGGTLLSELGYAREEYEQIYTNNLKGFVLEEDYGTAYRSVRSDLENAPQSIEQEFRICGKDGSIVWVYEKGTLANLNGERVYIVVLINITPRKVMEERLRVSEEEMRIAMEQMGRAVCLYDVKTHMLTMPDAYVKKHGFSSHALQLPERFADSEYLDDVSRNTFIAFYEAILRGEKSGTKETHIKCADGSWCWEYGEFATIFDRNGAPVKAIVTLEDTTERHLLENEMRSHRENELVWQLVAEHSNRLIYRYDIAANIAYADLAVGPDAAKIDFNVSEAAIEDGRILPESVADYRRLFCEIRDGQRTGEAKIHMWDQSGILRWIDIKYSVIYDEVHMPKLAVLSILDITESHEKELAYDRYLQTINQNTASEGVIVYLEADLTTGITEKQGGTLLPADFPAIGKDRIEVIRHIAQNHVLPEEQDRCFEFFSRGHLITQFSDGQTNLSQDWAIIFPDGRPGYARSELQMVQDPYTGHIKVYTILRDITKETKAALEVKKKAETDGMTGVYNKSTAEAQISSRLSRPDFATCALLVIDLDNLKVINDNLGHAQGDKAIQLIGDTLHAQFRQTDIIGRVGGDEFVAFLDNCGPESWLNSTMLTFMKKLSAIRIGPQGQFPLRASIGIAFGRTGRDSYAELFRMADKALYHVKRNGKNDFAFYLPEMEQTEYQYTAHDEAEYWRAGLFSKEELDHLLTAFSAVYPMVISVNLTKNSYYVMQYQNYTTHSCVNTGVFDELIAEGATSFHPENRAAFLETFSRTNLIAAYNRGKKLVSFIGRQLGEDGIYRVIQTDVIFVKSPDGDDVLQLTMARAIRKNKVCKAI